MANMREWIVEWTGPGHSPKLNVIYGDIEGTQADQQGAINTLLLAYRPFLNSAYAFRIRPTQRVIDAVTGELVGLETNSTPAAVNGSATGSPVADATQVLLRWETGEIKNGRFVKGRQYLPGCSAGQIVGGNVGAPVIAAMNPAATAFATSVARFVIWSRPSDASAGSSHLLSAGSTWPEFAVQRRRRG